jgi:AcrR family transcriptional regulator
MALYAERGYRGVGLQAIGEAAGVHHSTILYHFGTSVGLLVAVLEERDRQFFELTRPFWEEGGVDGLRLFPEMARFNVEHPELARLFVVLEAENLDPLDPAHTYFLERRRTLHQLIESLLDEVVDVTKAGPGFDAATVADEILAFQAGAHLQWALDPDQVDLVAMYHAYSARLFVQLGLELASPAGASPGASTGRSLDRTTSSSPTARPARGSRSR